MKIHLIKNVLKIGAISGVGITAWLAVKRADKIKAVVKEVKETKPEDTKMIVHLAKSTPKIIKDTWPVMLSGAATSACIIGMDRIGYKQIAALSAACAYLAKNRDFATQKLKEVVGDDVFKEFFSTEDTSKIVMYNGVQETGNGDELWVEGYFGIPFRSCEESVMDAKDAFNHLLYPDAAPEDLELPWERVDIAPRYAAFSEFYTFLNLEAPMAADNMTISRCEEGPFDFDVYEIENYRESGETAHVMLPKGYVMDLTYFR